jgi:hypothetical protein
MEDSMRPWPRLALTATHLATRPTSAAAFPLVKREGATGDPRTRYAAALRPWFVAFDGDAASFAALSAAQRAFYVDNRYLFVATDAHAMAPAIEPLPAHAGAGARAVGAAGLPGRDGGVQRLVRGGRLARRRRARRLLTSADRPGPPAGCPLGAGL